MSTTHIRVHVSVREQVTWRQKLGIKKIEASKVIRKA